MIVVWCLSLKLFSPRFLPRLTGEREGEEEVVRGGKEEERGR